MAKTPRYRGNSERRIIVRWHYGNDIRTRETIDYSTRDALAELIPDMPADRLSDAANALDGWRSRYDEWSWYRIVKVWSWDTRTADEILSDLARQDQERAQSDAYHAAQRIAHPERYAHELCDHNDGICNA